MICASCSTTAPLVRVEVVKEVPPEAIFTPVALADREIKTTRDVIDRLNDTTTAFNQCSFQLMQGRKWRDTALTDTDKPVTK